MTEASVYFGDLRSGNIGNVKSLVDAGRRVDEKDKYGLLPLHYAALYGRDQAIPLLLSAPGADVNGRSVSGTTPLHHAARAGHDLCLKALLDAGADLYAQDSIGWTCLAFAANANRVSTVKLLLERAGSDAKKLADIPTDTGDTPLKLACAAGNVTSLIELLKCGASTLFTPQLIRRDDKPAQQVPDGDGVAKDITSAPAVAANDNPGEIDCALKYLPIELPLIVAPSDDVIPDSSIITSQFAALLTPEMKAIVPPDVTLMPAVAGETMADSGSEEGIAAHKSVLVARCPFFLKHFSQIVDSGVAHVVVPGSTRASLKLFVEWIYSGTISELFAGQVLSQPLGQDQKSSPLKPRIPAGHPTEFADLLYIVLSLFKGMEKEKEKQTYQSPKTLLVMAFSNNMNVESVKALWKVVADPEFREDPTAQVLIIQCLGFVMTQQLVSGVASQLFRMVEDLPRDYLCELLLKMTVRASSNNPEMYLGDNAEMAEFMPKDISANAPESMRTDMSETNALLGKVVLTQELSKAHIPVLLKIVNLLFSDPTANWFRRPVDEERDHAFGYYRIIKHPMDLGTLKEKYCGNTIPSPTPKLIDVINWGRTIWQNAFAFNQAGSVVCVAAEKLALMWEKNIRSAPWPGREGFVGDGSSSASLQKPMSQKEIERLARSLQELPPTDVLPVLGIANIKPTGDSVDLDLSKLPPRVLREIDAYAQLHLPSAKKPRQDPEASSSMN